MKNFLLFALLLLTFSGCSKGDDDPEPPAIHPSVGFDFDKVYEFTGCKVRDPASIKRIEEVFVDEEGYRYLPGARLVNDIETFWFSKYKSDGTFIWEVTEAAAVVKGENTWAFNPVMLPNGNMVVACVVPGSNTTSAKEMIPTIINTNSGKATFVRVKEGYKYSTVRAFDDFFLCQISQKDLHVDSNAYDWVAQISNEGKLLFSDGSFNLPGEFSLFLNTSEYVTADKTQIKRTGLKVGDDSFKWSFTPSLPESENYSVEFVKEDEAIIVIYKLNTSDSGTRKVYYKLNLDTGEDYKIVYSLGFKKEQSEIQVGHTEKLEVDVAPADAPATSFIWKSSDEEIATVNNEGLVTAKKEGKCVITVASSAYEDIFDTCELEVIPPKNDIVFDKEIVEILKGDEYQITYTLYPTGATHPITWESTNNAIATVDANGVIKAHAVGTTLIKASINNGERVAECVVKVTSIQNYISITSSFFGSVIDGNVTGRMAVGFGNGSTKTIELSKLVISDGFGSVLSELQINKKLSPNVQDNFNLTFNGNYYPVLTWTYKYNGEEYQIRYDVVTK